MAAHSDYYCNKLSILWKNPFPPLPEQFLKDHHPVASFSQQWWYRYCTCKIFHITNFHLWDHISETLLGNQPEPFHLCFSALAFHKNSLDYADKGLSSDIPLRTSLLLFLSDEDWLNSTAQQQNASFHACCITWDWLLDYCYGENRRGVSQRNSHTVFYNEALP